MFGCPVTMQPWFVPCFFYYPPAMQGYAQSVHAGSRRPRRHRSRSSSSSTDTHNQQRRRRLQDGGRGETETSAPPSRPTVQHAVGQVAVEQAEEQVAAELAAEQVEVELAGEQVAVERAIGQDGVELAASHVSEKGKVDTPKYRRNRISGKQFRVLGGAEAASVAFEQTLGHLHVSDPLPIQRMPGELTDIAMGVLDGFLEADALSGGTAAASWPSLIVGAFPEFSGQPLRDMLKAIVSRTMDNRTNGSGPLRDCIEFYSGRAELTKAHVEICGGFCTRWDKVYGLQHDCSTADGLRRWVDDLSLAKPKALVWFGTQCSSFLLMTKKYSARDARNGFLGVESTNDYSCISHIVLAKNRPDARTEQTMCRDLKKSWCFNQVTRPAGHS